MPLFREVSRVYPASVPASGIWRVQNLLFKPEFLIPDYILDPDWALKVHWVEMVTTERQKRCRFNEHRSHVRVQ